MELVILIGLLGLLCGLLSGMLGIGGGIIMAPLLLYVPPLFGLDPLSMRVVAGLTIVQGLTAAVFGALAHHKYDRVSPVLTLWMGTTIFAAALVGGAGAAFVSNRLLLLIFGGLAAVAAAVILIGSDRPEAARPEAGNLQFSRFRAVTAAGAVGLLGGLVGQGGSFLLIPLMTVFIKIPHRIALGSNLAIVLLAGAAAFAGKALTGQIEWRLAVPVVVTVIPAAYLGGHLSQKVPVAVLRRCLAVVIALAAARIGLSLLG
ncbi:MAG: sulfite exporter TauE/SafE family protein [Desulfurivibrionaceae bacterium]